MNPLKHRRFAQKSKLCSNKFMIIENLKSDSDAFNEN